MPNGATNVLSIGSMPVFTRCLRTIQHATWKGQCQAGAHYPDESLIQVTVKLVTATPLPSAEEIKQWHHLDRDCAVIFKRLDNLEFGGRIREFTLEEDDLIMRVQLLNILCAYAPGEGVLPHGSRPFSMMMKGKRVGIIPEIRLLKIVGKD